SWVSFEAVTFRRRLENPGAASCRKGWRRRLQTLYGCDNRDLSRLKWFTYVHDVILEVNNYLILCAYEFGVKYSICSRVVIMEIKDMLQALLRQFLGFKS
ncbi:hypothetical protein Tco_1348777, partial [Tanacetum coccineum]